jgi:hypothetical protein
MNVHVIQFRLPGSDHWHVVGGMTFRFYDEAKRTMDNFRRLNPSTDYRIL